VIYAIPRYPVHLIDVVRLAEGSRITIRPTLPQDIELQRAFFRALSPEARRHRFMTRLDELPEALVERFGGADHASHVALLAEVFEDGRETMLGEARYVVERTTLKPASSPSPSPIVGRAPALRERCSTGWSARPPGPASGAWSPTHSPPTRR